MRSRAMLAATLLTGSLLVLVTGCSPEPDADSRARVEQAPAETAALAASEEEIPPQPELMRCSRLGSGVSSQKPVVNDSDSLELLPGTARRHLKVSWMRDGGGSGSIQMREPPVAYPALDARTPPGRTRVRLSYVGCQPTSEGEIKLYRWTGNHWTEQPSTHLQGQSAVESEALPDVSVMGTENVTIEGTLAPLSRFALGTP